MASGSTSRRSSRPRPGKRYMVTSQAVPVPSPFDPRVAPAVAAAVAAVADPAR